MAVTFGSLHQDAVIFSKLTDELSWWVKLKNDIRKDNQVNVYFEGGSAERIHYCPRHKKLQVFSHHKYLELQLLHHPHNP